MRYLLAVCALAFLLPALAYAQNPGPQGPMMYSSNCAASSRFGRAYLCFDTTRNSFYVWGTTSFIATAPTLGEVKATKLCSNSTVASGCTTNAANGEVGSSNATGGGKYWFGTGNNADLEYDAATGEFTFAGPTGGNLIINNGEIKIKPVGLASCPTCAAGTLGTLCYVNDGNNACTLDVVITSGGAKDELGVCSQTGGTYHYLAATCE